jgi:hypothetical protein
MLPLLLLLQYPLLEQHAVDDLQLSVHHRVPFPKTNPKRVLHLEYQDLLYVFLLPVQVAEDVQNARKDISNLNETFTIELLDSMLPRISESISFRRMRMREREYFPMLKDDTQKKLSNVDRFKSIARLLQDISSRHAAGSSGSFDTSLL